MQRGRQFLKLSVSATFYIRGVLIMPSFGGASQTGSSAWRASTTRYH